MFSIQDTGRYIAFMRKNNGMTQGQLAEKLGVSHQAVSNWERGTSMPDISLLTALAAQLDTTVDRLLMAGDLPKASPVLRAVDEDDEDDLDDDLDEQEEEDEMPKPVEEGKQQAGEPQPKETEPAAEKQADPIPEQEPAAHRETEPSDEKAQPAAAEEKTGEPGYTEGARAEQPEEEDSARKERANTQSKWTFCGWNIDPHKVSEKVQKNIDFQKISESVHKAVQEGMDGIGSANLEGLGDRVWDAVNGALKAVGVHTAPSPRPAQEAPETEEEGASPDEEREETRQGAENSAEGWEKLRRLATHASTSTMDQFALRMQVPADWDTLRRLAPYLSQHVLGVLMLRAVEAGTPVEWDNLRRLAPHVAAPDLGEALRIAKLEPDWYALRKLVPYLDRDTLIELIRRFVQSGSPMDWDNLRKLAPSAQSPEFDSILMQMEQPVDLWALRKMAPYLGQTAVDALILKAPQEGGSIDWSNLRKLASYASPGTLDQLMEGLNDETDWDNVRRLAPHLNRETIDNVVKKGVARGGSTDWENIRRLAPFTSQETLDQLLDLAGDRPNLDELRHMAPFMSAATIDRLLQAAQDMQEVDWDFIRHMAPFASQESLRKVVEHADSKGIRSNLHQLAPFLDEATIDGLVRRSLGENGQPDWNTIRRLAPFVSTEMLGQLLLDYKGTLSFDEILNLAPFLDEKTLDHLMRRCF